ncbi:MAG: histidine phosphatase family protein [Ruminococcus sp.]|nr:histidine phosphatase family protein [Ruminococcus sp.]
MKLLVIRHGTPDYEHDCLTEQGRAEAELLAKRLMCEDIAAVYTSPMGRARETAEAYTRLSGQEAAVCEWLHEFDVAVNDTELGRRVITWDLRPEYWTKSGLLYDRREYRNAPEVTGTEMFERSEKVRQGLDGLLAEHGLVREGEVFRRAGDTDKTLALFCHFGAGCVVTAHLLGISPMLTLQGFSADPTAVATLCTDDRFGEYVNFRLHGYGDTTHLGISCGKREKELKAK